MTTGFWMAVVLGVVVGYVAVLLLNRSGRG